MSEARRFLPGFLAWTEELLAESKAEPRALTREEDRLLAQGRPVDEIVSYWPHIDHEEIETVSKMSPVPLITVEGIIKKSGQLKKPAKGTIREWQNSFRLFSNFTGIRYPLSATRDDAQEFRNHLLTEYKVSTVKKIIRYLSGHWEVFVDEGNIEQNIWRGVLKHVKNEDRIEKPFDYIKIDKKALMLGPEQKMLYDIIRYTGLRIQEALGLRACDIDINERLIIVADHQFRKLADGIKNPSSRRKVPISTKLFALLTQINQRDEELVFERWLSEKGKWYTPSFFQERLGTGPHRMRGHVTTCLRDAGVNERVAGDLLGHTPTTNTNKYGTATIQALREAVEKIY